MARQFCRVLLVIALSIVLRAGELQAGAAAPEWLTVSSLGAVGIAKPTAGAILTGRIEVIGTAVGLRFAYYKVEYSPNGHDWVTVDKDYRHTRAVVQSRLATWDTQEVPNGQYFLRVVLVDSTGNFLPSSPVPVLVANPLPTPEPSPTSPPPPEPPATPASPGWLSVSPYGEAGISYPAPGATLSGIVELSGRATHPDLSQFWYYKVEWSRDGQSWSALEGPAGYRRKVAINNGPLIRWDTRRFPDGLYLLRVVVVHVSGNFVASPPVNVTIANHVTSPKPQPQAAAATPAPAQASNSFGTAVLTSPVAGAMLSGTVAITGTALSDKLWYYKLEWSPDEESWSPIELDYAHKEPVVQGTLALWDTTGVPNGRCWLRLVVVHVSGNFVATPAVPVEVANSR